MLTNVSKRVNVSLSCRGREKVFLSLGENYVSNQFKKYHPFTVSKTEVMR